MLQRLPKIECLEFRRLLHGDGIEVTNTSVITPHDTVPRFAANADYIAIANGDWSNPLVWNQLRVPDANAKVQIPDGINVRYDVNSQQRLDAIEVFGRLDFETEEDTSLWLNELMVMPEGVLTVGTSDNPVSVGVSAEIVFTDTPDAFGRHFKTGTVENPGIDPDQYGNGLLVFGQVILHGHELDNTFVRLDGDALAGDREITVQGEANWQVGDTIVIPDTRHTNPLDSGSYYTYQPQWETNVITGVSGNTVTLAEPLAYDHRGPRDADGSRTQDFDGQTLAAHAGNLTRNVTLRSENPTGVRGHAMFLGNAYRDIRYVAFEELGRTRSGDIDNTKRDTDGTITHIGTNQVGRYSEHIHHIPGPAEGITVGEDSYQWVSIGNSITGALRWGTAIHDSHFGLLANNVYYDTDGAAVATEDGSEFGNLITSNFVVRVESHDQSKFTGIGVPIVEDNGDQGDAFWFASAMNEVRDNVAANVARNAFFYWPKNIVSPHSDRVRNVRVPLFPGANTHEEGEYRVVNAMEVPVTQFSGNEVYGATTSAVSVWQVGSQNWFPHVTTPTTLVDTTVWHVTGSGLWFYYASDYLVDGWIQRGDPAAINQHIRDGGPSNPSSGTAIVHGGSDAKSSTMIRTDIQNMTRGYINRGGGLSDEIRIIDSFFDNYENIVVRPYQGSPVDGVRNMYIENVTFGDEINPGATNAVDMSWQPATIANARIPEKNQVLSFDGEQGLDVDLYYEQQLPDAIVPAKGNQTLFPGGLMTNEQGYAQYGIQPVGEIAPVVSADGDRGAKAIIRARALGVSGAALDQTTSGTFLRASVRNEATGPVLYYSALGVIPDGVQVRFTGPFVLTIDNAMGAIPIPGPLSVGMHQIKAELINTQGDVLATHDLNLEYPLRTRQPGATNRLPVIETNDLKHTALEELRLEIVAHDLDGTIARLELREAPAGAIMDSDGNLSWTPTNEQLGVNTFKILAVDNRGAQTTQTFSVIVRFNPQGERLLGSWSAENVDGDRINDTSSYDNAGTLVNASASDGSIEFPGNASLVKIDRAAVQRQTESLRIQASVAPAIDKNYLTPIVKYESGSWSAYELYVTNTGTSRDANGIRFGYFFTVRTTTGKHTIAYRTLEWTGAFDNVTATFDGNRDGGTISLFVNGKLQDSKTGVGEALVYGGGGSQQLVLGGSEDSRRWFNGKLNTVSLEYL